MIVGATSCTTEGDAPLKNGGREPTSATFCSDNALAEDLTVPSINHSLVQAPFTALVAGSCSTV